ncbi:ribosome-inactivating family protein [Paraburkholderia sp.]|uniref:ribosome-inactivating family protein n=1 Tax=Paraburkholderia sp. TaxID=1926495 RepID=UPI003D6EAAAF
MSTRSLRLSHGRAYRADIATLRRTARENGACANPFDVPVDIPNAPRGYAFSLIVNLACEPDRAHHSPAGSLDLLGFANRHGAFRFRRDPPLWAPPASAFDLGIDGSYRLLGYADAPLPGISSANLIGSAILLSRFTGPMPIGPGIVADALARLSIAVSEALRFVATESAVAAALDNGVGYHPSASGHRRRFDGWATDGHPLAL